MCDIDNTENFTWTNQTTKLLLQKYYERRSYLHRRISSEKCVQQKSYAVGSAA